MQATTTSRSWPAIGLGAFFVAVTARVLFDDVWAGAPVTTTHALSLAAIVAALAAGHAAVPELKAWRLVRGAALVVLFVAATLYVVVSSGARNAEVAAAKAAGIAQANAQRAAAQALLATAEADLAAAKTYHGNAVIDAAAECRTGKGKRCDGASETRDAAQRNVERLESHVALARTRLDGLKPAGAINAGTAHAANVLAALGLGEAAEIERRLVLVLPFAVVLITELGTIVFLGMGLGSTQRPARTAQRAPVANSNEPPPADRQPRPTNVLEHPVLAALRQAGRPLSNDELAHAMRVTKGEASKRRREVAGHLVEQRKGRHLRVAIR